MLLVLDALLDLDRLRTFAAFEFSDGTLKLEASLAEQACLILCCLLPVPQLPLRLSEFWDTLPVFFKEA